MSFLETRRGHSSPFWKRRGRKEREFIIGLKVSGREEDDELAASCFEPGRQKWSRPPPRERERERFRQLEQLAVPPQVGANNQNAKD